MDNLKPEYFNDFFTELHGNAAFPWQSMLVEQIAAEQGKWPQSIDLPTATGKTACLDVAVFLLALAAQSGFDTLQAPRRIYFVVDRRIVVDEAYDRASKLSQALSNPPGRICKIVSDQLRAISCGGMPLVAARMRGAMAPAAAGNANCLTSPLQPAIVTSTVDQLGSRLLFRSYSGGRLAAPIHAALAAFDSLIILDEAHCAKPFGQTAARVRAYLQTAPQHFAPPLQFVRMSATSLNGQDRDQGQTFPSPPLRSKALDSPELHRRLSATKKVRLSGDKTKADDIVKTAVQCAIKALGTGRKRIAIMFNRVALAHQAAELLKISPLSAPAEVELLTGRMRPFDRDALIQRLMPILRASKPVDQDRPMIVVTTQCLEVGADLSFDHIITECASLDALIQRFGRLNRLGCRNDADGTVLQPSSRRGNTHDPIYGEALNATWEFLVQKAKNFDDGVLDFSPAAIAGWLDSLDPDDLRRLVAPTHSAPELLPIHLDILCQTAPRPAPDVDVPTFLHGIGQGDAEVRVVFRTDISDDVSATVALPESTSDDNLNDYFELCPVNDAECFSVPIARMRAYLSNGFGQIPPDMADVEGQSFDEEPANPKKDAVKDAVSAKSEISRVALCRDGEWSWAGRGAIAPGDIIALPVLSDGSIPVAVGTVPGTSTADIAEEAGTLADSDNGNRHLYLRVNRDNLQRFGLLTDNSPLDQWLTEMAEAGDDGVDAAQLTTSIANGIERCSGESSPFLERLKSAINKSRRAQARLHPNPLSNAGGRNREFILVWSGRRDPESTTGRPDAQSEAPAAVPLLDHLADVRNLSGLFATHLPTEIRAAIALAAALHDIGKLDPRFQEMLGADGEPLAKSALASGSVDFRHEMVSMAILETHLADRLPREDILRDLVLHLVAAHHGYGRPLAPYRPASGDEFVDAPDFDPPIAQWSAKDAGGVPAHHLASGVAERFWLLTRHYGWWGLAMLEATVRLADWTASSRQNSYSGTLSKSRGATV